MKFSAPTTLTCTLYHFLRRLKPPDQTRFSQLDPARTSPATLAIAPNQMTAEEIKFIQFLLSGYDEKSDVAIQLSTGKTKSENPRFFEFTTLCIVDDNFRQIAYKAIKDYVKKIKASSSIPGINSQTNVFEYARRCSEAQNGSPVWQMQRGIIEPLEIFTSQEIADVIWRIGYIALLYREDLAKGDYHKYSDSLKDPSQSKVTNALTTYEKHLPILTREYPEFGIALKAKIKQYLEIFPKTREAMTTWQAQLPPAARS